MKISRQEIIAAVEAWHNCHPANSSDDDIKAILTAAYTVRRARKQAKRERQRKEKNKQVVESVKPHNELRHAQIGRIIMKPKA